jgi:murein DD-endopeptidase MepM/ murein hydrolase activator NlpD
MIRVKRGGQLPRAAAAALLLLPLATPGIGRAEGPAGAPFGAASTAAKPEPARPVPAGPSRPDPARSAVKPPPDRLPAVTCTDSIRLALRGIRIPVEGVDARALRDNFDETRGGHRHAALDIVAARGTRVLAVEMGTIAKLFPSREGGLTVYQFDRTGTYSYYYAHLDRYADGLREGMAVKQGDPIGFVGTSGNAPVEAPHLHFAIYRLGPAKRWWEGTPINPFPIFTAHLEEAP